MMFDYLPSKPGMSRKDIRRKARQRRSQKRILNRIEGIVDRNKAVSHYFGYPIYKINQEIISNAQGSLTSFVNEGVTQDDIEEAKRQAEEFHRQQQEQIERERQARIERKKIRGGFTFDLYHKSQKRREETQATEG